MCASVLVRALRGGCRAEGLTRWDTIAQGRGQGAWFCRERAWDPPSKPALAGQRHGKSPEAPTSLLWEAREVTGMAASGPAPVGPLQPDSKAKGWTQTPEARQDPARLGGVCSPSKYKAG